LQWVSYLGDRDDSGGGSLGADEGNGAGGDEGGSELHVDGGECLSGLKVGMCMNVY